MLNERNKQGLPYLIGILVLIISYSCASVGTPNGGPYDEKPPVFLGSTPTPNQTNFTGNKVELLFDELIQLEKPGENVIITPPQRQLPVIRAAGKKISVELKDTLILNTTYTIDFTNSISDNNEKNILENFSIAFSTGEVIDSLEVSGVVLNAENLEPMPGITIGLHSNLEDSAFVTLPFERTSRTNDRGRFTIRNIAPGTYRIYALNDINRDYLFDQPGEDIAYLDSLVIPSFEPATRLDTTWVDSLTIDTIKTVGFTRFLPDNIQLRLFKELFARQYMLRPERNRENMFTLKFNSSLDTVPALTPVNFTPSDSSWYYIQTADEMKSVNYWITDSLVWKLDTLQMSVTYPLSDSLNILQAQTDTVQVLFRRQPAKSNRRGRKEEDKEKEKIDFLQMNFAPGSSVNVYDTLSITFDEPVLELPPELFYLNQKVDTLWVPVEFEMFPDSINTLKYNILRKWSYEEEYMLEVDSAAIYNVYGKWNNKFSNKFKIKSREDYGHLYINIIGVDTTAFVELLNSSDKAIRKEKVKNGGVLFMNLKPEKYYARLVVDLNDNGKWDTGNYAEKRQPEEVYYCPKLYSVMQNWEVEESWNIHEMPLHQQKPLEILKNKPKEVTKKKRDHRNEGRQNTSNSSGRSSSGSGRGMGMPF
ncbi:Ig-like domain-containing protein [Parabacteroides sp. OttesenSCG-928-N08]|nr:Ig-like domain-containing protein [Parabacteroides sp. OttesenSCG-928-N08]